MVDDDTIQPGPLCGAPAPRRFVGGRGTDGARAIDLLGEGGIDLVVLDQTMPGIEGVDVCRHLRDVGDATPILMLTARETVSDRVSGLDAGADDYLVKPFALEELLARIRSLLRRQANAIADVLTVDDLEIDVARHTVTRAGHHLELTRTEFVLLELLARNEGIVLTRDQIMVRVWGYDGTAGSNSLDVYVSYVRRKDRGRWPPPAAAHGPGRRLRGSGLVTLRTRVALAATLAVLVTVAGVSYALYLSIGRELRRQVDVTLQEQGDRLAGGPGGPMAPPTERARPLEVAGLRRDVGLGGVHRLVLEVLDADGTIEAWRGSGRPSRPGWRRRSPPGTDSTFEEVSVDGAGCAPAPADDDRGAAGFGRSLAEVERSLDRLAVALVAGQPRRVAPPPGSAGSSRRGRSHPSTACPTRRDSSRRPATSAVDSRCTAATRSPPWRSRSTRCSTTSTSRSRSNANWSPMPATSCARPLTTLRTNIEVLGRVDDLPDGERDRILSDVTRPDPGPHGSLGGLIDLARRRVRRPRWSWGRPRRWSPG